MLEDWDRIEILRSVRKCCVGIQDGSCWTEVNGSCCLVAGRERGSAKSEGQIEAGAHCPFD